MTSSGSPLGFSTPNHIQGGFGQPGYWKHHALVWNLSLHLPLSHLCRTDYSLNKGENFYFCLLKVTKLINDKWRHYGKWGLKCHCLKT